MPNSEGWHRVDDVVFFSMSPPRPTSESMKWLRREADRTGLSVERVATAFLKGVRRQVHARHALQGRLRGIGAQGRGPTGSRPFHLSPEGRRHAPKRKGASRAKGASELAGAEPRFPASSRSRVIVTRAENRPQAPPTARLRATIASHGAAWERAEAL